MIDSFSTHNRGGEITYKWVSGTTYDITVTTYTKEDSQADRCELTIFFGDGDSCIAARSNGDTTNPSCTPRGMGVSLGNNIKMNKYKCTHTYPSSGNYVISMEDPNRNGGIINIPNSINTVFYIQSSINVPCALNSVEFSSMPTMVLPKINSTPVIKQNIAAMIDGNDSLSFELVPCKEAQGINIAGYTYPPGLTLNPVNGEMIWDTYFLFLGEYNIAVKVNQWRNGSIIGYVIRDFQVAVPSINNSQPLFEGTSSWSSNTSGYAYTLTPSNKLNLNFTYKDLSPGNTLTLAAFGQAFSASQPALFTTIPFTDSIKGQFSWTPNNLDGRKAPYIVTFRATSTTYIATYTNDLTLLIYVQGNNITNCTVLSTQSISSTIISTSLFPNPANEQLYIKSNSKKSSIYTLTFINTIGQTVWQQYGLQNDSEINIDHNKLAPGLYFYELIPTNSHLRDVGKILIE